MESTITLIKGDSVGNSLATDYRDALPVNMYAVERAILGAAGYMIQYPGLSSYATGEGADRGGIYNERFGEQFRLSGTSFVSITSSGGIADLGSIAGVDQASLPYSFNTQCVIADKKMFLYSPDDGLKEVTDTDLGDPIDGVWVDGYYFLTDGEFIYHTDISDESSIDPLKFATAEFSPDPTLGVAKTQDNKVLVFGRYSLEYFINVATENFAFQRVPTRAQKIGIVATHAKCEAGTGFYITGGRKNDDVSVYAVSVGSSQKVSTREIDKILKQYTEPELSGIRMESRTEDNTTFVLIHLPTETLCFNETMATSFGLDAAWTILKSDARGSTTYRAINGVWDQRLSKWIYGDKFNDKIGYLDNTVGTQYGEVVEWILYTPFIGLKNTSIHKLEIETIPGHTLQGDATVAFSMTFNGVTYGTEWWVDYGDISEYDKRFIVRRIGYVKDWVGFKLRGANSSRVAFATAVINYG